MAKHTPMMEQYLSIKEQYQDAFLFFRLGDFYELFFEDAVKAAQELEITLTGRGGGAEERIPMCGVPYHSVDTYIAQLIDKGYKVAICEQMEDPKQAKGVVKREVTRLITPGTVMEGNFLTDKENNYLVAVYAVDGAAALAACDISTGEFYLTEVDSETALLDEILRYNPSEVIDCSQINRFSLKDMLAPHPIVLTFVSAPEADGGVDYDEQLARHFNEVAGAGHCSGNMLRATLGLLAYLKETQKRTMDHLHRIELYEPAAYMVLDQFTRRNLELVETIRDMSRKGSLLWMLDQTSTAMGGRLLRRWVDRPLLSKAAIEKRQQAVEVLYHEWLAREEIRRALKEVYDLERLAGRIAYGSASARDLIQLKSSLLAIPALKQQLEDIATTSNSLQEITAQLDACPDIVEIIDQGITDDPPLALKEGGLIKDGYDEYLDRLRTASRDGKQWIASLEKQEREATGIRSLKVGYNKVFGYYIEVTRANLAALPEGRYERKQTLANAERFITPELKEKEALILEADEKRTELEYQLFVEIRDKIAGQVKRLQDLALQVAAVDVIQSLAALAQERSYTKPAIVEDGRVEIADGRHPVVETVVAEQSFVPNDTHLLADGQQMMLITGPNMAGKSTYMRQVALIMIMAQLGSFVPAQKAVITPVDRIFTRIGAADDLVGGQSTFMVEMKEIEVTLRNANARSLVIIDELGRGTSTSEGMSIAQAVIEYLHDDVGCKTLVSTHYHELSHLEDTLDNLKNYHMAVEESGDSVVFLRKLIAGPADKSYGIYCAQIAGIPDRVIQRANHLLEEFVGSSEGGAHRLAANETAAFQSEPQQLDLFGTIEEPASTTEPAYSNERNGQSSVESQIVKKLKDADLMAMTPLDAINFVFELKKQLAK
ncbi:DNA mismatch repair protein MutS [Aneurinibacillus sp. Ricciae_BoGa-3]|uniref:DNA mismatch repair protein MutS n=1 Tax=Aneurinibacillus sp. Ricciae_BoGa-3 TaxID=3022697 RepID=UPI002340F071|nr:DNA mismatch repair protein MutS [Aneurinibacillus sp. Ricciae_BoGa-3]WCK56161.1 DNA mismatch repair protein MutS [Aneurinibacillus sp. Ricciae_BoGa-3]